MVHDYRCCQQKPPAASPAVAASDSNFLALLLVKVSSPNPNKSSYQDTSFIAIPASCFLSSAFLFCSLTVLVRVQGLAQLLRLQTPSLEMQLIWYRSCRACSIHKALDPTPGLHKSIVANACSFQHLGGESRKTNSQGNP